MTFISLNAMESTSHAILKKLKSEREMPLRQLSSLLPKKFNDHRDLYPLVNLITGGYVDSIMSMEGKSILQVPNRELAITLHTSLFGKGEFEYQEQTVVNDDDFGNQLFFCTAKGDLYLEVEGQKRADRIWTLCVGIAVGVIVAIVSMLIKLQFQPSSVVLKS